MTRLDAPPAALRALHLFVLSSFAFAQPLFDLLGRTPEFFVARGSTAADVIVFAAAVVLLPPALLLATELLVALVSRAAAAALHVVFVALLAALVALQALKRVDGSPAWVALVGAAVVGALAAVAYSRARPLRTLVTVLAPAPLLFVFIFMSNSPIRKLALEEEAHAAAPVAEPAPVVFVVLDELPTVSLLDAQRRIDPVRYPAFAALARDATWYRNATTVHEHTTEAVPAMLTGKLPRRGALPLVADHPENLFTLLGDRYDLVVSEPVTQLCPQRLCRRERESFPRRMRSLGSDLGVVYLHVLLPDTLTKRLPSVTETWQGFGDDHHGHAVARVRPAVGDDRDIDRMVGQELWRDQRFVFERFVGSVRRTDRPALYFLHVLLPHAPWRFLPSGRQYGNALSLEGLRRDVWTEDPWLVTQAQQRHLLQVGFTDALLGSLLKRLREAGLYDRSLIIVTADHGASFRPGDRRRAVTPTNAHDIARVPLFVKLPRQRDGRIVDRHVTNVDIVPTIAEALEMPLSDGVDGRPLDASPTAAPEVWVRGRVEAGVRTTAVALERGLRASLRQKIALFGHGRRSLYAVGPNRELVGRPMRSLRQRESTGTRAVIDGATLLRTVDPGAALVPTRITGRVDGASTQLELAIAINGMVAAVTRTFADGDATRFTALVPESALRAGVNDVQVFAVARLGGRFVLERLTTTDAAAYALAPGARALEHDGQTIPVVGGAVRGHVEDWFFERDSVRFGGWAADAKRGRVVDAVVAFAGSRVVYVGGTGVERTDLRVARENPELERSGFVFELPRRLIGDGGTTRLRFFAVSGDTASELSYARGFPWRR